MKINWQLKKRISEICGSQADFSKIARVPEATISKVIRGRQGISVSEQRRWAVLLRCEPEEIFQTAKYGEA